MKCKDARNIMDTLFDQKESMQSFSLDKHLELRNHLDECNDCSIYLHQVLRPLDNATAIQAPPVPPDLAQQILNKLPNESIWSRGYLKIIAVSSLCIICFIAGLMMNNHKTSPSVISALDIHSLENSECSFHIPSNLIIGNYNRSIDQTQFQINTSYNSPVIIPSCLTAQGQFQLDTTQIKSSDNEICMGFFSPSGEILVLHLKESVKNSTAVRYRIEPDPSRVLSYTVTWFDGNWECRMTGRLPADYLLDFAREIKLEI